MKRHLLAFAAVATLTGCVATQTPPPAPLPAAAPAIGGSELLNAVLWMQTAAEYRASSLQAFNVAQAMLDRALTDSTWSAAEEQIGTSFASFPPAVIVDIDETVLDNSPFEARMIRAQQQYSEPAWEKWVSEASAQPLPGALEFAQYANQRGVTVYYISNRREVQESATRANLERIGFPLSTAQDTLLLRTDSSDKSNRRKEVAARYRVLLLVGDDLGDFSSATRGTLEERRAAVQRAQGLWGTKWIMLPNPMYGSWERTIVGSDPNLTLAERLRRKVDRLNAGQ